MNRNSKDLTMKYFYKYNDTAWYLNYGNSGGGEFSAIGEIITFWYKMK